MYTAFEKDVMVAASVSFGPVTETILRDRASAFSTDQEFEPFHALLRDDIANFLGYFGARSDSLRDADADNVTNARNVANLIREIVFHKIDPAAASMQPIVPANASWTAAAAAAATASAPTTPAFVAKEPRCLIGGKWAGNFSLKNGDYVFGCGANFPSYETAMAHKVIAHGYSHHKYTMGWATDLLKKHGIPTYSPQVVTGTVVTTTAQDPDPDPKLVTQTNLWTPTTKLDLNDLGLKLGEAGRFAAGEESNARFYFIRLLNKPVKIKGKFVWTKFAHRFNWEHAYTNDFIVRKLAGDTKEWVGIQKVQGVANPAYTWNGTEPRLHFPGQYVGDHEADIQEILHDPETARIHYGLWRQECSYCGRNLTDPESRKRGIGPECWEDKHLPRLAAMKAGVGP